MQQENEVQLVFGVGIAVILGTKIGGIKSVETEVRCGSRS